MTHTDYAVAKGGDDPDGLGRGVEMLLEELQSIERDAAGSPLADDCRRFREEVLAKLKSQGWGVKTVEAVAGLTEYRLTLPTLPRVDPGRYKPGGA
jgi:hypothetical protein